MAARSIRLTRKCPCPGARGRSQTRVLLYQDDGATLDDLREAVATLESVAPLWKRVFGPSHPETPLVQNALEDAREALAARAA